MGTECERNAFQAWRNPGVTPTEICAACVGADNHSAQQAVVDFLSDDAENFPMATR